MTKTTVEIAAASPAGVAHKHRNVTIQLVHGGAGGSDGETVIGGIDAVDLGETGTASVDLDPNEGLNPAGTFYRLAVIGVTPSVVRDIRVPVSATPISWADPAIEVTSPVPPSFANVGGVVDIDALGVADTPLDGTEKIAGEQTGVAVAFTTEDLTPSPLDSEARRGRDRFRRHTHLTDTTAAFAATDGVMFGVEPVICNLSGTAAAVTQTQASTIRYGTAGLNTGTTPTGFAAVHLAPSRTYFVTTSSDWKGSAIAASEVASGAQDFTVSVGFMPVPTTVAPTLGMFFRHTSASANWIAVTKAAAGETTTDTGIPVTSGANFLTLEVRRAAGGNAVFYIGGLEVADHSTRLPDNFSFLTWGVSIKKSVGSTAKNAHVDFLGMEVDASAAITWGAL
jgi:hypothetical protein